jgi:hypothetical protein
LHAVFNQSGARLKTLSATAPKPAILTRSHHAKASASLAVKLEVVNVAQTGSQRRQHSFAFPGNDLMIVDGHLYGGAPFQLQPYTWCSSQISHSYSPSLCDFY